MGEQHQDKDEALIAAWRAAPPTNASVSELAQRVYTWMCKQDRRLVFGNKGEELAAEVVRHAVRKFPSYRGDSAFFTWVLGIARNVLRSHYRRENEEPLAYLDEVPGTEEKLVAPDVEMRELLGEDAIKEARQSVLTDLEREVFALRWDQELAVKDIADRLGMTEKNASGTGLRAARKVYAYLQRHELL